ncbi:disintegrin and metalloproteinase domain-containing protein 9-like [Lampetra planeri]
MASGASSSRSGRVSADAQVWLLTCRLTCRLTWHASLFLLLLLCWMMSALPLTSARTGYEGSFSVASESQTSKLSWYDITVPYTLEGRQRRDITHRGLKFEHPERVEIVLEVTGQAVLLLLERNKHLIPPHFKVSHNGSASMQDLNYRTHCFYHGTVAGQNESTVALSTCDGLRGRFLWHGVSYAIEPLEGSTRGEHLVYKLEDLNTGGLGCGVVHENVTHFEDLPSLPIVLRKKRAILTDTTRWVEFVLVVGATLYKNRYNSNRSSMVTDVAAIVNLVDLDYKTINIRVVLVGLHLMTTEEQALVVQDGDTAGSVVGKFAKWRQTNYNTLGRHDCGHLLTWESFGGIVGMAFVGTICSRSSSAGIASMPTRKIPSVAAVVAHEMGHNLGMSHDRSPCQCTTNPCIMNAGLVDPPPTAFSECSTSDFENLILVQRGGSCLLNVPTPNEEFRQPVCGDSIVDKGEECDCGSQKECNNPCCEASTCKLKGNAECAYGLCCKNCKIMGQGESCRPSVGACDLPEYCNGSSQFCYTDTFIQNGYPCQNGSAYCYNGVCLTLDYQCQSIWGGNAASGSDNCYLIVNTKGNEFGNCGQRPNGFVTCTTANIKCGKLVCENTPMKPLIVDVPNFASYQGCNAVNFNYGTDIPDPGLVQPGTKCDSNSVCMDNQCQNATVVLGTLCNTTQKCSGHGVCDNNLNCYCNNGYAPPDCYYSGYGGSIESGNSYKPSSRLLWLLLLLLFIPLITGGAYFYWSRHGGGRPSRRKGYGTAGPFGIPRKPAPAASAARNQGTPTVAVITPGNPPARPPPPANISAVNGGYQPHASQPWRQLPDVTPSIYPARAPPAVPSAPHPENVYYEDIDPKPELPSSLISPVRPPPAIPSAHTNAGYDNYPESQQLSTSSSAPRINPVRPPPAVPNVGFSTDVSYVPHDSQDHSVVMLGNQQPGWKPPLPQRPKKSA